MSDFIFGFIGGSLFVLCLSQYLATGDRTYLILTVVATFYLIVLWEWWFRRYWGKGR